MLQVEIWSDVACPWCYVGKRRFEQALNAFPHRDDVTVVWRSFELDPHAPTEAEENVTDHLAAKYGISRLQAEASQSRIAELGAQEGLTFHFDSVRRANTFDAHRLLHFAAERGVQAALKERLFRAYFSDGESVADRDTLVRLTTEVGLDPQEVRSVLEGGAYAETVRGDEEEARSLGISGVPFFVLDRRYGVSGAQPAEAIRQALDRAWEDAHPKQLLTAVGAGGTACTDDGCAI